jgi:hypothetical protein
MRASENGTKKKAVISILLLTGRIGTSITMQNRRNTILFDATLIEDRAREPIIAKGNDKRNTMDREVIQQDNIATTKLTTSLVCDLVVSLAMDNPQPSLLLR